jgi:hypothetical protein
MLAEADGGSGNGGARCDVGAISVLATALGSVLLVYRVPAAVIVGETNICCWSG